MDTKQQSNNTTNSGQDTTATETWKGVITIDQVVAEIQSVCMLPESLIKAVLATCISVKLGLPSSLWLLIIGSPSSAKTDMVNFLRNFNLVYFVDTLTQNPFASGYIAPQGKKSHDMLPQVNKKCLVIKDYTTIFSLNSETVRKLLGELVSIYDGQFRKFSPTKGLKEYETNFSHIGCITPLALNRHTNYMNIIGPRFLFYRIPKLDEEKSKKGFEIAWQSNRKEGLTTIGKLVNEFLSQTLKRLEQNRTLPEFDNNELRKTFEQLATFTSRSRGIVLTKEQSFIGNDDKEVTYNEIIDRQIEEPWRAFQQLRGLAIALSIINQTYQITQAEIDILIQIVLSSMPVQRAEAIECFKTEKVLTANQLSQLTQKSIRTSQRLLKELEFLGILESSTPGKLQAKEYSIKQDYKSFFYATPSKSVSRLEEELITSPKEKLRSLFAQNLKQLSDQDLALYLKTAEKWLTDNLSKHESGEYGLIDSVWAKLKEEVEKREREANRSKEPTEITRSLLEE